MATKISSLSTLDFSLEDDTSEFMVLHDPSVNKVNMSTFVDSTYEALKPYDNLNNFASSKCIDDYSWRDLYRMCVKGDFLNIRVGDYKTESLSVYDDDENSDTYIDYKIYIMGIDTHIGCIKNEDGDRISHNIDFIFDASFYIYGYDEDGNSYDVGNNGTSANPYSYLSSFICSGIQSLIYNALPSNMKRYISPLYTFDEARYSTLSSSLTSASRYDEYIVDYGYIWVPSELDIFGARLLSGQGYTSSVKYPFFDKFENIIPNPDTTSSYSLGDSLAYITRDAEEGSIYRPTIYEGMMRTSYTTSSSEESNCPYVRACFRICY